MLTSQRTLTAHDGLSLHTRWWAPDGAPNGVVCLVHGLGEHCGRYDHVAERLTGAGYAVAAHDLRGHGRSGGPRGHAASFEAVMDDISLMLDEAAAAHPGLPRFLYGHSLGGALVLNHALRRRPDIAGAIVTGPGLRPARPQPPLKLILGRALVRSVPALPLDNGLDRTGISRDPAVCAAYRDDPLVHGRVSARFGLDILTSGEWALAHAAEFAYPLLLVQGSDDRIVSPDATREFAEAAGPGVTFQVWDGLYHECHNEPERADVLEAMVAWLKEHSLPAGPDPLEGATAWPRAS